MPPFSHPPPTNPTKPSWDQVRRKVRAYRAAVHQHPAMLQLSTIKDFSFDTQGRRLIFLANDTTRSTGSLRSSQMLFWVDLNSISAFAIPSPGGELCNLSTDQLHHLISSLPNMPWYPLLPESFFTHPSPVNRTSNDPISREEQFSKERRRLALHGISSYQFEPLTRCLLFSWEGGVYIGKLGLDGSFWPSPVQPTLPLSASSHNHSFPSIYTRHDPKLSPINNLTAFIRSRDIYVTTVDGTELQLTFSSSRLEDPESNGAVSCGLAEFVMQEEFHRFTGYVWASPRELEETGETVQRIVYIRTDESNVDLVYIPVSTPPTPLASSYESTQVPTTQPTVIEVEEYRYPRPGRRNVKSEVWCVEFVGPGAEDSGRIIKRWKIFGPVGGCLPGEENEGGWEYIVRFGWVLEQDNAWVHVLNRLQTRSSIFILSLDSSDSPLPPVPLLIDHAHPQHWINVSDIYYFLPSTSNYTRLLVTSEVSGFRHLYLVERHKEGHARRRVRAVTWGSWCVQDRPIFVCKREGIGEFVFFVGRRGCVLESHAEVVKIPMVEGEEGWIDETEGKFGIEDVRIPNNEMVEGTDIRRLTTGGFSHSAAVDVHGNVLVDLLSSVETPPACVLWNIVWPTEDGGEALPWCAPAGGTVKFCTPLLANGRWSPTLSPISPPSPSPALSSSPPPSLGYHSPVLQPRSPRTPQPSYSSSFDLIPYPSLPLPEFFTFTNSSGIKIHGLLYKPEGYIRGNSYPTLLHVYGGPKSQAVTRDFKYPRHLRLHLGAHFRCAVVQIDNRGSAERGVEFERSIWRSLGRAELDDQVEGLRWLAETCFGAEGSDVPVVDLERVSITGWSYGGYLGLMALVRYPTIFRMAVVGAPVVKWEHYDSAYTERYLGFPDGNGGGGPFEDCSIISHAKKIPPPGCSVLVAHGLMDENVHFTHTEMLFKEIGSDGGGVHLQVYPTERHGLRAGGVNEHFETLLFYWVGQV